MKNSCPEQQLPGLSNIEVKPEGREMHSEELKPWYSVNFSTALTAESVADMASPYGGSLLHSSWQAPLSILAADDLTSVIHSSTTVQYDLSAWVRIFLSLKTSY